MNLYLLDKNYDLLGEVEAPRSFIWTRRYYEHGTFELHCNPKYFDMINSAKYLYRNDRDEIAVIHGVYYTSNESGVEAYCTGTLGESILDDRVIDKPFKQYGTPEEICRELVNTYVCEPDIAARKIPHVSLGEVLGSGEKVQKQVTGDPVGHACYEIEKTQEMSHRLRYDFQTNDLFFEVWQGKDRRESQTENSWAIFSKEFRNIKTVEYTRSSLDYANVAYVAGEGEGIDRKVVEVDIRTDPEEERREIYVDARDLQNAHENTEPYEDGVLSLDPSYQYTEEEYEELLRQRGLEKLAERLMIENMTGDLASTDNLVYLKDFDLGDYGTFKYEDIGIEIDARITEIIETYENTAMNLTITFGQDTVTSIRRLIKQEVR